MHRSLILLVFGLLAASAHAQISTNNTLDLDHHLLIPQTLPCPMNEAPPLTDVTPITIRLTNGVNIEGVQSFLRFDSGVLEFVDPAGTCLERSEGWGSVLLGDNRASFVIRYDFPPDPVGKVAFSIAAPEPHTASGTLITFYARAKPNVPPGTVSSFTVDTPATFMISDGGMISPPIRNGSITVGTAGDVDGNWKVDAQDAVGTLKFAVQITTPTPDQERAADMDGDRHVSVHDTVLVLKKAIGLLSP